jgi:hypothetical protein
LDTLEDLREEIEDAIPGPEREELERTLEVCQDIAYLVAEGFIGVEEDGEGELRLYPEAQCHDTPPIEA